MGVLGGAEAERGCLMVPDSRAKEEKAVVAARSFRQAAAERSEG